MTSSILITEVGMRDGLQNEKVFIETLDKVSLVKSLLDSGSNDIEVTSFVHKKLVPQMSDAELIADKLPSSTFGKFSALVPNLRGWSRVDPNKFSRIGVLLSSTESFCKSNLGCSIEISKSNAEKVLEKAKAYNVKIRAYISCAISCPYEGDVSPHKVRKLIDWCENIGVDEIDLGDTIGVASAKDVDQLISVISDATELDKVIWHAHDTYGRGLLCVARALHHGITRFDTSIGGFGGCPFAPGAAGNLSTEALISYADREGLCTGIDLDKTLKIVLNLEKLLGRRAPSNIINTCRYS